MRFGTDKAAFRPVVWTFVASFLFRLALAWTTGRFHNLDRTDMERLALSLAHTGVIADMMVPGLPSAGEAPGYVILMASIFRVFGDGALGETVKVLGSVAASSLRCALTVWLAGKLRLGRTVMIAAGILSVFWIGGLNTEIQGDWDPPYTAVALILLFWLQQSSPYETRTPRRAALLGAAWAFGGYLNFSILAIPAGYVIRDLFAQARRDLPRFARQAACIALGGFLVLLPWGIRNRIVVGEWVFSRDMLGYGLALSYHDGAHALEPINNHPSYLLPGHPDYPSMSPYPHVNPTLRAEVARLGELEWDRQERRKGLTWMAAHPWETISLMAQHTFYFWFPPGPNLYFEMPRLVGWPYAIAKWMLTILAAAGLLRLWKLSRPAASSLAVILFWFPLVYYLVNWSSRYRMPIEWVLVLLASVAAAGIYQRFYSTAAITERRASTIS